VEREVFALLIAVFCSWRLYQYSYPEINTFTLDLQICTKVIETIIEVQVFNAGGVKERCEKV